MKKGKQKNSLWYQRWLSFSTVEPQAAEEAASEIHARTVKVSFTCSHPRQEWCLNSIMWLLMDVQNQFTGFTATGVNTYAISTQTTSYPPKGYVRGVVWLYTCMQSPANFLYLDESSSLSLLVCTSVHLFYPPTIEASFWSPWRQRAFYWAEQQPFPDIRWAFSGDYMTRDGYTAQPDQNTRAACKK